MGQSHAFLFSPRRSLSSLLRERSETLHRYSDTARPGPNTRLPKRLAQARGYGLRERCSSENYVVLDARKCQTRSRSGYGVSEERTHDPTIDKDVFDSFGSKDGLAALAGTFGKDNLEPLDRPRSCQDIQAKVDCRPGHINHLFDLQGAASGANHQRQRFELTIFHVFRGHCSCAASSLCGTWPSARLRFLTLLQGVLSFYPPSQPAKGISTTFEIRQSAFRFACSACQFTL